MMRTRHRSRASARWEVGAAALLTFALIGAHAGAARAAVTETTLTAQVKAAQTQAVASGQHTVRFAAGGYWDNTTQEAYIDRGPRVARLVGGTLVTERPTPSTDPGLSAMSPAAAAAAPSYCSVTTDLTHCETVTNTSGCNPTYAWLNYEHDHFFDHWPNTSPFHPAYPGEYIKVRNNPYRTYAGPRGIRTYRDGTWTVMSGNCLSGGLP